MAFRPFYFFRLTEKEIDAKAFWDKIIHNAWKSAEPGVLFWDTITRESLPDCYNGMHEIIVDTNRYVGPGYFPFGHFSIHEGFRLLCNRPGREPRFLWRGYPHRRRAGAAYDPRWFVLNSVVNNIPGYGVPEILEERPVI